MRYYLPIFTLCVTKYYPICIILYLFVDDDERPCKKPYEVVDDKEAAIKRKTGGEES